MRLLDNTVVSNGQMGVAGIGAGALVQGNEIAYNNTMGFSAGWEAGGTKFVKTLDLVVRDNHVHHNAGPGLWTDIDNDRVLYEDNLVEWNDGPGISHEISFSAVIRNNQVHDNGLGFDIWLWGAQIMVQNSSGAEVYGNQVTVSADGGNGIVIVNQARGSWETTDNYVHDNVIVYLGDTGMSGLGDDTSTDLSCSIEGNNRFDHNSYQLPDPSRSRWHWCNSPVSWAQFLATGNGSGSTLIE